MENLLKPDYIPKLRTDLEFIPSQYDGKRVFVVKDSLGLIKEPLVLQGEVISLLSLIDGNRSVRDIQLEFIRINRGLLIDIETVGNFISDLDTNYLLVSSRYQSGREKKVSEYSRMPVRVAHLAGKTYPDSEEKLREYLEGVLKYDQTVEREKKHQEKNICALIAPHIDIEVGKKVYSQAYRVIKDKSPQKIVLLGTGHSLREYFLSVTEKDFETPFGRLQTDKEWVEILRKAGDGIIAPDDLSHRHEHSLEFQLIFLQYLFGNNFSLVPMLFGSFHEILEQYSRPASVPGLSRVLETLRDLILENGPNVLLVGGVDFSHIGPKFGHRERASSMLLEAKAHDQWLMDAICRGDVESMWEVTRKTKGKYNVCGFSVITCLLEICPDARGEILDYVMWEEDATQSAVSFAAMAMFFQ